MRAYKVYAEVFYQEKHRGEYPDASLESDEFIGHLKEDLVALIQSFRRNTEAKSVLLHLKSDTKAYWRQVKIVDRGDNLFDVAYYTTAASRPQFIQHGRNVMAVVEEIASWLLEVE